MSASQIFLVIVSGLGVIHGLFLAIFLLGYPKGNKLSNRILSVLLIILSFRVGKSVFLEFTQDLDIKFILIGLGTLMAIGPLFYFYCRSCSDKTFKWSSNSLSQFIPAFIAVAFGFWINDSRFDNLPKILFAILIVSYYGHLLFYLIRSNQYVVRQKEEINEDTFKFLRLLFGGLLIIWFAYVLNLFDDLVPYIVGPILYSIVAYVISFIVIQNGYIQNIDHDKYKTTPVSDEQAEQLYKKVLIMIEEEKQFRDSEITLKSMSTSLNISPQILSLVINQKSKKNFNNFINSYRVEAAVQLFNDKKNDNLNISAIAYEVGFNSISSFNTAFKKITGRTPQAYRQQLSK